MPSFILPMTLRYVLVSVAATLALMVVSTVLVVYGIIDEAPSSSGNLVIIAAGWWAGTYFAKQTGRMAEWAEAFRIGAVLTAAQLALSVLLGLLYVAAVGPSFAQLSSMMSLGLAAMLIAFLIFISGLLWLGTAVFLRMGSKSLPKAKKA